MMAYAQALATGQIIAPDLGRQEGNVIWGEFPDHAKTQQRRKALAAQGAGMSPMKRALMQIGITTPDAGLRRVK